MFPEGKQETTKEKQFLEIKACEGSEKKHSRTFFYDDCKFLLLFQLHAKERD